ncbi:NAD(P)-dependent oxidoreductase [Fluviispira multicolorata]|uniref:Quinate/shikimate 5-dehydrogenase/glutamyl-tRNA reductase domain-containing protein n=1 Tax=Fluviispira multicolorata TaxID=2654512 RepID=A0A833JH25_9BACT|nr:NAD(P)-dependent oxidoreductase [Fluviispira multicolorata]KAB8033283.1 hypothetical protein GCL57_00885 [Fluviispira multicolorata]
MNYIFHSPKLNELRKRTHFLYRDVKEVYEKKPLNGIRILHCAPLTYESLCKVEPLVLAGASLTMTGYPSLVDNPEVEALIIKSPIKYQREISYIKDEFDIFLDFNAELVQVGEPKIGTVELTQIGSEKYKKLHLDYPVISLDETQTKVIECKYGTNELFLQAFQYLTGESLKNKQVVLFGCGKVGSGILESLVKQNAKVTIIDNKAMAMELARYYSANFIDSKDVSKVKIVIKKAFCVVCATGINNLISKEYKLTPLDFADAFLVDMGGADEFGDSFPEERVLANKKPINFMLENPYIMEYVDPIFYAQNLSAFLLLDKMFPFSGYYPFPKELDEQIVNIFEKNYLRPEFSWKENKASNAIDFFKSDIR